jgi:uncharacterized protein (DUF1778 family)
VAPVLVISRRVQRLAVRLRPEQQAKLQRAADLSGRSLADFIIAAAEREADETIRRHEIIELSGRGSLLLAAVLLNPPAPNATLRAAWGDYQSFPAAHA